ncbi:MAG TPA: bifunctional phosphoribosylaminoimidazolecarboxamide formyltransferase/IMP cyclohydrolase [Pyrinomonadaceae bacterium]|jgi:phosphoribosylaminoimidazolecarboxamide formyltransferase/IMP cyclohydrolase
MSSENSVKIKRALISVSDKEGIVEFARELEKSGVEIISTGGTARALQENGITVREVSDLTGFPEMMGGRVKTLHPKIHGALLGLRDNDEHLGAMREHGIEPIDLVVVNLYPFEETVKRENASLAEAVEQIDIGGPAMIRSASKNWQSVAVVTDTKLYDSVLRELRESGGALSHSTRQRLAVLAFMNTSRYDLAIFSYLEDRLSDEDYDFVVENHPYGESADAVNYLNWILTEEGAAQQQNLDDVVEEAWAEITSRSELSDSNGHVLDAVFDEDEDSDEGYFEDEEEPLFAADELLYLTKIQDLRYGENPHQQAAVYESEFEGGVAQGELLGGKEMSFNNYLDADAAFNLVSDFDETACAIIKHTNPSGVGIGESLEEAYARALATDPVSAFGGIVAFNRAVNADVARALIEIFTEVVVAPEFETDALEILRAKKNLRILSVGAREDFEEDFEFRQISGGFLVQTCDRNVLTHEQLKVVTKRQPTENEIRALQFAWRVAKHVKSNAIVYANEFQTVGVGAGQMSRIDSVKIGAQRAVLSLQGTVLASDAFFPFRDGIDEAAKNGITAIIQPGGSMRDEETIDAADAHNLAMIFTGIRHFKH